MIDLIKENRDGVGRIFGVPFAVTTSSLPSPTELAKSDGLRFRVGRKDDPGLVGTVALLIKTET